MSPVHLSLQKKEGFHRMIEKLLGGKFPFLKIFSHIYWQQNLTFKKMSYYVNTFWVKQVS